MTTIYYKCKKCGYSTKEAYMIRHLAKDHQIHVKSIKDIEKYAWKNITPCTKP